MNAYDQGLENLWDASYPAGGNWWSDYNGSDEFSGPNQDKPGSDGIGDIPYDIPGGDNQDQYPLMELCKVTIFYVDDDNSEGPWYGTLDFPYQLIQDGIDNADDGSRIFVFNGTYYENIFVDKSIELTGEEGDMTIVDGSYGDYGIQLSVNQVNITGLIIQNSNIAGICVTSDDNHIIGNTIKNNNYSILAGHSSNNVIAENTITNNSWCGIALYWSSNNNVVRNTITNNDIRGLSLHWCDNNVISGNAIAYNEYEGIYLVCSSNNSISINNITDSRNGNGIYLLWSSHNVISGNTIANHRGHSLAGFGVYLIESTYNTICSNTILNNELTGICLSYSSSYNIISNNTITDNGGKGVTLYDSSNNNHIYHNNFINNTQHAYDKCNNLWDNGYPSGGNYWDDYNGRDNYWGPDQNKSGSDDIGDIPYYLNNHDDRDQYPLYHPVMIVDDADQAFEVLQGTWSYKNHTNAFNDRVRYSNAGIGNNQAGWRIDTIIDPGEYEVYVWKFEHKYSHLMATNTPYIVVHKNGQNTIRVDQSTPSDEWISLGTFEFDNSHIQGVLITDNADGYVIADAIKLDHPQSPPEIIINFAGNPGDLGGPYWTPPGETLPLLGDFSQGYYTNDSRQKEDWIVINITVRHPHCQVWLHWYDATVNIWTNNSYQFKQMGGDYWEFNSSGIITDVAAGYNYSFDILAFYNFNPNLSKLVRWEKTIIGGGYARRYIQLNCTPTNPSYLPYYCYEVESYQSADSNKEDRLHHDQGPDGGLYDTGYLLKDIPSDDEHERHCGVFIGYWFDESICAESFTLQNVYHHFWWNTSQNNEVDVTWFKTNSALTDSGEDRYLTNESNAKSQIIYDSSKYYLEANLLTISSPVTITDNNIYELVPLLISGYEPSCISNRSFVSFVLLNVPDDMTLNATYGDSDEDGLSDWTELYVTYTSPFLYDTDNDGVSDYCEIQKGSDPNNYMDSNYLTN